MREGVQGRSTPDQEYRGGCRTVTAESSAEERCMSWSVSSTLNNSSPRVPDDKCSHCDDKWHNVITSVHNV